MRFVTVSNHELFLRSSGLFCAAWAGKASDDGASRLTGTSAGAGASLGKHPRFPHMTLKGGLTRFTGADAHGLLNRRGKDLAIADFAGFCGIYDGVDNLVAY